MWGLKVIEEPLTASLKRSLNHSISLLEVDGENLSNAEDIGDTLNNYFSTIGEKLAKNIGKNNTLSYTHFLKNRIPFSLNPPSIAQVYTELCLL